MHLLKILYSFLRVTRAHGKNLDFILNMMPFGFKQELA